MNWRQLDLHPRRHGLHLGVLKTQDCNHFTKLRKGSIIFNFLDWLLSTIECNLNDNVTQHVIIKMHQGIANMFV